MLFGHDVVDSDDVGGSLGPRCVADTRDTFCKPVNRRNGNASTNFFKEAKFSPDGTTVITHNEDQSIRAFVLPPNLLDENGQSHELAPYSVLRSASNVQSYAIYSGFNLSDPSTTLILSAPTDLPLRVTNALDPNHVVATYSYTNPSTEAFIAPNSLAFINGGTQFVAGSQGRIATFDVSRTSGPELYHKTKSAKHSDATHSMRDSSRIMALSVSCNGILAAGSTDRNIGLFGQSGRSQCETAFSVAGRAREEDLTSGTGITSLEWTPDGTYLLVAERQSNGIHVYDVRNQLRRVSFLSGRSAKTPQRLGMDVVPALDGCEVWAGGVDGCVRMWKNPGSLEIEQKPDAELKMHDSAVSSTVWHPNGVVLATCSGQRAFGPSETGSDGDEPADVQNPDNSLKLWEFLALSSPESHA